MREAAAALLNEAAATVRAEYPHQHVETAPFSGGAAQSLADICPLA